MSDVNKRGWPKGRPRNTPIKTTEQQGPWAWNGDKLMEKMQPGAPDECWTWLGSSGPHGLLFGARKNGRPQMTQANRLIYMTHFKENIEGYQVRMACKNKQCCNWNHFRLEPHNRINPTDWIYE